MNAPDHPDPLDALLREDDAYVEDRGFTARVMATLPPRRRSWLRPAILFTAVMIGSALLSWRLPDFVGSVNWNALLAGGFPQDIQTLLPLGALLAAAAALAWAIFTAIASED